MRDVSRSLRPVALVLERALQMQNKVKDNQKNSSDVAQTMYLDLRYLH